MSDDELVQRLAASTARAISSTSGANVPGGRRACHVRGPRQPRSRRGATTVTPTSSSSPRSSRRFAIPPVEAMAAGLPVMASAGWRHRETIVDGGTGNPGRAGRCGRPRRCDLTTHRRLRTAFLARRRRIAPSRGAVQLGENHCGCGGCVYVAASQPTRLHQGVSSLIVMHSRTTRRSPIADRAQSSSSRSTTRRSGALACSGTSSSFAASPSEASGPLFSRGRVCRTTAGHRRTRPSARVRRSPVVHRLEGTEPPHGARWESRIERWRASSASLAALVVVGTDRRRHHAGRGRRCRSGVARALRDRTGGRRDRRASRAATRARPRGSVGARRDAGVSDCSSPPSRAQEDASCAWGARPRS